MLTLVMLLCAASLLASAIAPTFVFLCVALSAVGATTVSGQIILPMVGDFSASKERGKMVGIVTSGITAGILLARTVSGAIASVSGWRTVFLLAVCLNLFLAFLISRIIPNQKQREKIPYRRLLISVFTAVSRSSVTRRILLMQGLAFLVFNLFWTSITLLLSSKLYGFDTFQIGLVSLAGLAGAIISTGVGKLQDMGLGVNALGLFIVLYAFSMVLGIFSGDVLYLIIVCAIVMSLGFQGVSILNQTLLFSLNPGSRSRINTAFVANNFAFGAIGSLFASLLWSSGGWQSICIGATCALVISLLVWFVSRNKLDRAIGK